MRLAEVSSAASEKLYEGVSVAGDAARRGADAAYRGAQAAYGLARTYPKTSIASAIAVAALVGGVLWYLFGDPRHRVERRRKGQRVRAHSERRRSFARNASRTAA